MRFREFRAFFPLAKEKGAAETAPSPNRNVILREGRDRRISKMRDSAPPPAAQNDKRGNAIGPHQ
jgi:hypothetical protein